MYSIYVLCRRVYLVQWKYTSIKVWMKSIDLFLFTLTGCIEQGFQGEQGQLCISINSGVISWGGWRVCYYSFENYPFLVCCSWSRDMLRFINCRSTFLLDGSGRVVSIEKSDLPVGLNMGEQLRHVEALHALRAAEGQVQGAPADWEPGHPLVTQGFRI